MTTLIDLPPDVLKIIFEDFDIGMLYRLIITDKYLWKVILNSPQLFWWKHKKKLNFIKKKEDSGKDTLINLLAWEYEIIVYTHRQGIWCYD